MRGAYLRLIRGQLGGPLAALCRAGLRVASWGFSAGARLRGRCYDAGILRAEHPGLPVISVGNVTAGGTGKTPIVTWIAGQLLAAGHRPAVLSRGYRAAPGQDSDEAAELRRALPGVIAVQNPDRLAGAETARAEGADVLVLDDGFQHRRIARDLDVVAVSALDPDGAGGLLPRGLLREPLSALRRADLLVLTHVDQASPEQLARARELIARAAPEVPVLQARHAPAAVVVHGRSEPPEALAGRRCYLFCGLGSPDSFFQTVESLGAEVSGRRVFDDHHPYGDGELAALDRAGGAAGAEWLVTSRKDAVRIQDWPGERPLAVLEVEIGFEPAEAERLRALVTSRAHAGQADQ